MFCFLILSFLLKLGASQEADNCLQERVDKYCADNTGYNFARYDRENSKWRCYAKLNEEGETAFECIKEDASGRTACIRHADNSPYVQKHNALLLEGAKGCIGYTSLNYSFRFL